MDTLSTLKFNRVDVYAPGQDDLLNLWVRRIMSGEDIELDPTVRYWVHIRDIERAEQELRIHREVGEYTLCGRRAWSQQMVLSEIALLWNRYSAAISGTHTAETLGDPPSPAASSVDGRAERPNLAPLHEALLRCGSDGWRPLTSIRVGIMECIAFAEIAFD